MAQSNTAGVWTPPPGYENLQDPFDRRRDYFTDNSGVINVPYDSGVGQNPTPDIVNGDMSRVRRAPADPNPIPQVNIFGSESTPFSTDPMTEGVNSISKTLEDINRENTEAYRNEKLALAGAQFFSDVMNAQSRYNNISARATMNIFRAHMQMGDARSRAAQRALLQESAGVQAGQDAILELAAQGQDVNSAGVQRVTGSLEAIGQYNAMIEEINGAREALGYELEALDYQSEIEQAEIQRNYSFIGAGLNLGASSAPLFLRG